MKTVNACKCGISEQIEVPNEDFNPPDGRPLYPATCEAFTLSDAANLNFFGFTMISTDAATPGDPSHIIKFFPQVLLFLFFTLLQHSSLWIKFNDENYNFKEI